MKSIFSRFATGVRVLFGQAERERDLDDEVRAYLDAAVDAKMALGMSRAAATRAARLEMGSLDGVKDRAREAGWESILETTWQDVRYASRLLRKAPGFTAAAVLTLGLGIGGTTAVFSVVDALFFRAPAGVTDPGTLRRMYVKRDRGSFSSPLGIANVWADSQLIGESGQAFSEVASYRVPQLVELGRGETADRVRASVVSQNFLGMIGVRPAAGRFFTSDDDETPGARPVVVISYAMWQSRFAGAVNAIGQQLLINGRPMGIIGIAQREFDGIDADAVSIWIPSAMAAALGAEDTGGPGDWRTRPDNSNGETRHIARLSSVATDAIAASQANAALQHAAGSSPDLDPTPEIIIEPIVLTGVPTGLDRRLPKLSLWTALASCLLLLIACANVANLLLARAVTRRRELAMRLSLGAGTWRVARQQLTEGAVLALLGCGTGLVLAYWAMQMMQQFPVPPRATQIGARVLAFSLGISILTTLLFGLIPALRAARIDPLAALKGASAVGDTSRHRMSRTLVGVQVSLSLAMLIGAALFVRSLNQVAAVDGGVAWRQLLVVSANLDTAGYTPAAREEFFDLALSRLSTMPGVTRAVITNTAPFGYSYSTGPWSVEGRPHQGRHIGASLEFVGPDYFETAGTRVLRGRSIGTSDKLGNERIAVVNDSMARLLSADGNPIGLCLNIGPGSCVRVVGVVETQRDHFLFNRGRPIVFRARAQTQNLAARGRPALLVRTAGDPDALRAPIRFALQGLRSDLPYIAVESLAERIRPSVLPFHLGATLFGLFGGLAAVLAGIGLYGLLRYFVAERTAEIGLRRALGAPAHAVVSLIARQSLVSVAIGLVAGLAVALLGTRYLSSLLFGVEARDPIAFGAATAFLFLIGLLATVVPAIRAARVDPMVALRHE